MIHKASLQTATSDTRDENGQVNGSTTNTQWQVDYYYCNKEACKKKFVKAEGCISRCLMTIFLVGISFGILGLIYGAITGKL
jgi:hypothetical protein